MQTFVLLINYFNFANVCKIELLDVKFVTICLNWGVGVIVKIRIQHTAKSGRGFCPIIKEKKCTDSKNF